MDFSIGSSACHIGVRQIQNRNAIANDDKSLFNSLLAHKSEIETAIDISLDWRELPKLKVSRIVVGKSVELEKRTSGRSSSHTLWIFA